MRLAERSLGVGEVVRPRAASRFEAASVVEPLELVEEREAAPAPERSSRRREAVPVSTPRDESPSHAEPLGLEVVVEREGEAAQAERPSPGPSEPRPAPPAPATEPPSAAPEAGRDPPPETPPPATVVVRDRRPPVSATPRAQERASGSEPRTQAGESPLALPPVSPPAPERLFAGPSAADEPPVVRVTIGRVDVRAVLPAAPPERPRPKRPPRLSLDEYLREGRRP